MTSHGSLDIQVNIITAKAEKALQAVEKNFEQLNKSIDKQSKAADRANKANDKLNKTLAKMNSTTQRGKKNNELLSGGFFKLGARLSALNVIADTVTGTIKNMTQMFLDAGGKIDARNFFEKTGRDIKNFTKEVNGVISEAAMIKNVNLANTMGISDDEFKTLSKVAQAASIKFGESFEHMLSSITLGSARGSKLLLDNLGIIIDSETAYKRYAEAAKAAGEAGTQNKSIKDLVEMMSDAQKKAAIMAEAVRIGGKDLAEMGDLSQSAGGKVQKVVADMENAWDNFTSALTELLFQQDTTLATFANNIVEYANHWVDHLVRRTGEAESSIEGLGKVAAATAAGAVVGSTAGPLGTLFGGAVGFLQASGTIGEGNIDKADQTFDKEAIIWGKMTESLRNIEASIKAEPGNLNLPRDITDFAKMEADQAGTAAAGLAEYLDRTQQPMVRLLTKGYEESLVQTQLFKDMVKNEKLKKAAEKGKAGTKAIKAWDGTPEDFKKKKQSIEQKEAAAYNKMRRSLYNEKREYIESIIKEAQDIYQSLMERRTDLLKNDPANGNNIVPGLPDKEQWIYMFTDQKLNQAAGRTETASNLYKQVQAFGAELDQASSILEAISLRSSSPEAFADKFGRGNSIMLGRGIGGHIDGEPVATPMSPEERVGMASERRIGKASRELDIFTQSVSIASAALQGPGSLMSTLGDTFNKSISDELVKTFDKTGAVADVLEALNIKMTDAVSIVVSIIVALVEKIKFLNTIFDVLIEAIGRLLNIGLSLMSEWLVPLGEAVGRLLVGIGYLVSGVIRLLDVFGIMDIIFSVVNIILDAVTTGMAVLGGLFNALVALVPAFTSWSKSIDDAASWMLKAAIDWVNGIITLANTVNDAWGGNDQPLLKLEDFVFDNTEATKDNTEAVNSLNEELKNLPSGFKVGLYQYGAQRPGFETKDQAPGNYISRNTRRSGVTSASASSFQQRYS